MTTKKRILNKDTIKKMNRERWLSVFLVFLLVALTIFEFLLFETSRSLPFFHSIFFFGLVNFNIILFLFLFFFIFRDITKSFVRRSTGITKSLKGKLIISFMAFSFIPTFLMLVISVLYINNSFEKWFSEKTLGVLTDSLIVSDSYQAKQKEQNYHFAREISEELKRQNLSSQSVRRKIKSIRDKYQVDVLEYYPSLKESRVFSIRSPQNIVLPPLSKEVLKTHLKKGVETSFLKELEEGSFLRFFVPVTINGKKGAVVVSSFISQNMLEKLKGIQGSYEEFRNLDSLEYPVKSIYLIILILMTMMILAFASWFGLYLARRLSVPLEVLGETSRKLAKGEFEKVKVEPSGSGEVDRLIEHFNNMTIEIESAQNEVRSKNKELRKTLEQLDENTRYLRVVLANVETGVISMDKDNRVITMNEKAIELLKTNFQNNKKGRSIEEVLPNEVYKVLMEMMINLRGSSNVKTQSNVKIDGKSTQIQFQLSLLKDNKGKEIGKVLVFDDLTPLLSVQRAIAWKEVVRRVAHEIKNPLTPILLSAERLEKKFGKEIKDEEFSKRVNVITDQVYNLKNLVNEFTQFARFPELKMKKVSVSEILKDLIFVFKSTWSDVNIQYEFEDTPPILLDQDQIKRAVTNLLDNALTAIEGKKSGYIKLFVKYKEENKSVHICVEDNGVGISKDLKERLFEPYITTKEHGTGLGLTIVEKTVREHNGDISVFSSDNRTQFVIILPVEGEL